MPLALSSLGWWWIYEPTHSALSWLLVLLVLVLGATAIPALLDAGRYALDKLFFSPEVRDFRQRLLRQLHRRIDPRVGSQDAGPGGKVR